jgi:hypothetical protein
VTVVAATDTDTGSGVGLALLQRPSSAFSAGSCATFDAFTTIATDPAALTSTPVTPGNCYQYRYLVFDNVGNQTIFVSSAVLQVEPAVHDAPAP